MLDKVFAAGDLIMNVAMDASMVVGVGEGLRAAYVGVKVAEEVGTHALEDVGEHALEDVGEHAAEDVGEHAGEDAGEQAAEEGDPYKDIRDKAKTEVDNSLKDTHIQKSYNKRGWTKEEILDTIENGTGEDTADITNGRDNPQRATRFTNPDTGRAVIVNNTTGLIKQLGDKGFLYDIYDDIAKRFWGAS